MDLTFPAWWLSHLVYYWKPTCICFDLVYVGNGCSPERRHSESSHLKKTKKKKLQQRILKKEQRTSQNKLYTCKQHLPETNTHTHTHTHTHIHTHSQESAGGTAAQCYANQWFINRTLNYQTETGSDTHAFIPTHTRNQSVVSDSWRQLSVNSCCCCYATGIIINRYFRMSSE